MSSNRGVRVRVSYLEIYNEEIRDLLNPASAANAGDQPPPSSSSRAAGLGKAGSGGVATHAGSTTSTTLTSASAAATAAAALISVREDGKGGIEVKGALQVEATSLDHVKALFEKGCANRATAGTLMNAQSSRSHAVFTVYLDQDSPSSASMHDDGNDDGSSSGDRNGEEEKGAASSATQQHQHRLQQQQQQQRPPKTPQAASSSSRSLRGSLVRSKFHFVDLAGSERAKRTGVLAGGGGDGGVGQGGSNQGQLLATQGLRLRESKGINQGLLALGKVISALTSLQQRQQREGGGGGGEDTARTITATAAAAAATPHLHVPYRDSKLTRLLQDSLGGNSATAMLACISPADNSVGETVNTLKYASKARQIVNAPVVNVEVVAAPTPPAAASVAASKGRGNDDKDSLDGDTGEDIYQAPLPSSSLPDEEALRKRVATLERLLRQQQLGSKMINNKTSKRRDHERQGRRRRGGGSAANGTREEGSSSKAGGDDDDDDTEELALALLRAEATLVKVRGALVEMASSSAPSSGALQGQQQQQQQHQSGALSNAGLRRLLRLLDEHDVEDIGNGLTRAGLLTADPDHKLEPWEAAKFGHADHSRADHSRAGAGISCAGDVCGECGRDADCAAGAGAGGGAGGGSGGNKAVLGAWSLAQCCCGLQKALWLARREAAKLRQELGEAKGDLSRDEEIFAEKLKELRDAQDEAILLQERNEFLESNVEALKEKVSTLEKVAPQNQNLKKKKSGNYKKDKQRTTQKNGNGLEKEKKKEKFKKKRNREYEGDLDRNTVNGGGGSCGGAKDEWGAEAVNGGDRTGLVAGAVAEAKQSARGDRGERSSSSISSSSPSLRMKHSCKGEGNGGGGDEKESKGGAEEKDMLAAAATVVVRRKRGQWGNPNTNAPSLASSSAPSLASSAAAPAIPAAAAADGKTRRNHLQPLSSAAATARKQHQRLQGEWQALEAEAGRAQAEARALEVEVRDGLDVVAELVRAAVLATAEEEHSRLKERQAGSKVGQQRAGSPKPATGGDGTRHGGAVDMWSQGDENDDDDGDFEDGGGGGGYTNGGASNNKSSSSSSSGSSVSSSRGGSTRGGNRSGSDGGGGGGAAAAVVNYSHVIEAAEKEVEDLCAEATSRGHVLSGLVSSAKEAVELVGKYRDRMSTLQAEVATLRSALLSAADTLLHHSPSDTPRSVVQGTKARKQALQLELDARTKELRALAMQEEEQRRVTALKRQTDDRASEIRRELEAIHGRQRDAQRHLQRLLRQQQQQQQHGGEGSASGGHGFDTDDAADAVGEPTKSSDETAAVAILHKKEDAGGSTTNRKREEEVERDATSEQDRRRRRVFESQRLEAEAAVAVLERRWKACVLTAQRLKQEAEQAKQQVVAGEMALRAEEAELEEEVKAERSVEIEAIVAGKKRGWGSDRNCDDNDGGDAGGRNAGDGERIGEEEKRMDSDGWKDGDDDDGSDDESGNESDDESDESTSDNDTDYASDSDDDEDENADEYGDDNYHDECGYGNKDEEEVRGWVMKALEVAVAEVQHTRTQALKQQQQQPPATTIRIREAKAEVATQLALRSRVVSAQTQLRESGEGVAKVLTLRKSLEQADSAVLALSAQLSSMLAAAGDAPSRSAAGGETRTTAASETIMLVGSGNVLPPSSSSSSYSMDEDSLEPNLGRSTALAFAKGAAGRRGDKAVARNHDNQDMEIAEEVDKLLERREKALEIRRDLERKVEEAQGDGYHDTLQEIDDTIEALQVEIHVLNAKKGSGSDGHISNVSNNDFIDDGSNDLSMASVVERVVMAALFSVSSCTDAGMPDGRISSTAGPTLPTQTSLQVPKKFTIAMRMLMTTRGACRRRRRRHRDQSKRAEVSPPLQPPTKLSMSSPAAETEAVASTETSSYILFFVKAVVRQVCRAFVAQACGKSVAATPLKCVTKSDILASNLASNAASTIKGANDERNGTFSKELVVSEKALCDNDDDDDYDRDKNKNQQLQTQRKFDAALLVAEEERSTSSRQLKRAAENLRRVRAERDQLRLFIQTSSLQSGPNTTSKFHQQQQQQQHTNQGKVIRQEEGGIDPRLDLANQPTRGIRGRVGEEGMHIVGPAPGSTGILVATLALPENTDTVTIPQGYSGQRQEGSSKGGSGGGYLGCSGCGGIEIQRVRLSAKSIREVPTTQLQPFVTPIKTTMDRSSHSSPRIPGATNAFASLPQKSITRSQSKKKVNASGQTPPSPSKAPLASGIRVVVDAPELDFEGHRQHRYPSSSRLAPSSSIGSSLSASSGLQPRPPM